MDFTKNEYRCLGFNGLIFPDKSFNALDLLINLICRMFEQCLSERKPTNQSPPQIKASSASNLYSRIAIDLDLQINLTKIFSLLWIILFF